MRVLSALGSRRKEGLLNLEKERERKRESWERSTDGANVAVGGQMGSSHVVVDDPMSTSRVLNVVPPRSTSRVVSGVSVLKVKLSILHTGCRSWGVFFLTSSASAVFGFRRV